nr:MAG TPA: hypothetical protein [Caudoviricetes sp.]
MYTPRRRLLSYPTTAGQLFDYQRTKNATIKFLLYHLLSYSTCLFGYHPHGWLAVRLVYIMGYTEITR